MTDTTNSTIFSRRYLLSSVGTTALVGMAGCSGSTETSGDSSGDQEDSGSPNGDYDSGTITFGQPAIKTGGLKSIQPPVSLSSTLAKERINSAGGPLGREIELIRRDTGYDPETAREAIDTLVTEDDAVVLNGLTSTTTVPNWNYLRDLGVPVVTMYAGTRFLDTRGGDNGTPKMTADDGWHWRTVGGDSQHTAAAAIHANRSGVDTVGVLNTTASGSQDWMNAFTDAIDVIEGIKTVASMEVASGKDTYEAELRALFETDFDLFAVAVEEAPDTITILNEWDANDYEGKILLTNPMKNEKVLSVADRLSEDWVRVAVPAVAGPYAEAFNSQFRQLAETLPRYRDNLSVNNWSAAAYDAITVSALAIQRAGEATPTAVQKNLGPVARPPGREVHTFAAGKEALENGTQIQFTGAQTNVNFTDNGDVFNTATIWELGDDWQQQTQIETDAIRDVVEQVAISKLS